MLRWTVRTQQWDSLYSPGALFVVIYNLWTNMKMGHFPNHLYASVHRIKDFHDPSCGRQDEKNTSNPSLHPHSSIGLRPHHFFPGKEEWPRSPITAPGTAFPEFTSLAALCWRPCSRHPGWWSCYSRCSHSPCIHCFHCAQGWEPTWMSWLRICVTLYNWYEKIIQIYMWEITVRKKKTEDRTIYYLRKICIECHHLHSMRNKKPKKKYRVLWFMYAY